MSDIAVRGAGKGLSGGDTTDSAEDGEDLAESRVVQWESVDLSGGRA